MVQQYGTSMMSVGWIILLSLLSGVCVAHYTSSSQGSETYLPTALARCTLSTDYLLRVRMVHTMSHQRCRDCLRSSVDYVEPLQGPYNCFVGACVYCLLEASRKGERCRINRYIGLKTCATSQRWGDSAYKCLKQCPCLRHR